MPASFVNFISVFNFLIYCTYIFISLASWLRSRRPQIMILPAFAEVSHVQFWDRSFCSCPFSLSWNLVFGALKMAYLLFFGSCCFPSFVDDYLQSAFCDQMVLEFLHFLLSCHINNSWSVASVFVDVTGGLVIVLLFKIFGQYVKFVPEFFR